MDYIDIVKPSTFADESYLRTLTKHMRQHDPVPYIESGTYKPFWLVTKHSDIIEIERQHLRFPNTIKSALELPEVERQLDEEGPMLRTLIHMDEPDHKKYRDLTRGWFMPENIKTFEPRVRQIAREAVDRMFESGSELDFVRDVGVWYPLRVIMMILGVPAEDEKLMLKLTQELLGNEDPDMQRDDDSDDGGQSETIAEYFAYFNQITEEKRARPTDDVASTIANAKIDGRLLDPLEAVSYYVIIATAGHDTTSSALAGGLLALLEHPDELRRVQSGNIDMGLLVEEAIRWTSPVKHFMRYATEDYELRGKSVKSGDALMMLYPSGNRDEEVFDDPARFVADRRPNRHLAFGHGAHHCLGHLLAKMEMRYLYEELFGRVNRIELAGEPRIMESNFVTGLKTLPVHVTAQ
ncbi:MAG: cytochrome P450 [Pseudomonadales bacterium]|nr:cytochrome P450 [Pseudomonadales bacterium]